MSPATAAPMALEHEVILASAGSGKTWQLTTRFLRLLAGGVAPEHVLATTFTRKAAGEIFTRLLARLSRAAVDERALAELNAALGLPAERRLDRARCSALLASAVRTLDRFQVRTLDSVFADLARLFGLDLGLPPGWSVVEEVDDRALRSEAVGAALADAPAAELAELLYALHGGRPRRSVHEALLQAVQTGYAIWLDSEAPAWDRALRLPPAETAGTDEEIDADSLCGALEVLALPLTKKGQPVTHFAAAVPRIQQRIANEDLSGVLGERLVACVLDGSNTFSKVPLDAEWIAAIDATARWCGRRLAAQLLQRGRAHRRLLERFHHEYVRLQRERRAYRFDDLPRALERGGLDLSQPETAFRLGARVEHLLLDEFQDTSVLQWRVLRPLAESIVRQPAGRWGLLCVGDVKQAIYGWREGESRLLQSLYDTRFGGRASTSTLEESYRSSPVVLELVNRVFIGLADNAVFADEPVLGQAARQWAAGYKPHRSAPHVRGLPGAARLIEVPLDPERNLKAERTAQLMVAAAEHVRALVEAAPQASIAVLLRRREPSARLLRELRQRGVLASGEGGNALTDSDAVRLALSLLHLADHPGDTAARFHLEHSPLAAALGFGSGAEAGLAARVRAQLHERGYGEWLAQLEPQVQACPAFDAWERGRFRQLVELGLAWDGRTGSRPSDFVQHVRLTRVEDPSSARVRVMTVHGAKGLEFDAVVLPDLDEALLGRGGDLVTVRPDPAGPITAVYPRPSAALCSVIDELRTACDFASARALQESLCVLYVALTRARRRLDVLVPAAYSGARGASFARLLRHALLGADAFPAAGAGGVLWAAPGTAGRWFDEPRAAAPGGVPATPPAARPAAPAPRLEWSPARPRALPRRSPSQLEGGARIAVADLLSLQGGAARGRGVLVHRWLEELEWIEDLPAADEPLLAAGAEPARRENLAAADQRAWLAELRAWLARPATHALFDRNTARGRLAGLAALAASPDATAEPSLELSVQRERRFAVPDERGLLVGSIDRVVLALREGRPVAAEIIDYKTDRVAGGALDGLVEHYRPQLQAYRRALCALTGLAPERVACRLLFLESSAVRDV